jgi:hypothetical protein
MAFRSNAGGVPWGRNAWAGRKLDARFPDELAASVIF